MRKIILLSSALLSIAFLPSCGTDTELLDMGVALDQGSMTTDAGTPDLGSSLACNNIPFGPDCCGQMGMGNRLTGAECQGGTWVCTMGEFCRCGDDTQAFSCSDFCGSDAFIGPTCTAGGWTCGGGVRTDTCPADTCWGLPPACCDALQTQVGTECAGGNWICPPGSNFMNCG